MCRKVTNHLLIWLIFRFVIESNCWENLKEINTERCFATAVGSVDNQFIYLFGGYRGEPLDTIER